MSKIALVDSNRTFLASVSTALKAEGLEVESYSDGEVALDAFSLRLPDLVVLDVKSPQVNGMDLLERLRRKSSLPVILMSSREDEIDELWALRMGADDYLRKPCSQLVLLERIRALLRRQKIWAAASGEEGIAGPVMVRGPLTMDAARYEVTWKDGHVTLSPTEFLLLQAIARRPGLVVSRSQLLGEIGDTTSCERVIDGHIKRIRKKMREVDDGFLAIKTVYGVGYRYSAYETALPIAVRQDALVEPPGTPEGHLAATPGAAPHVRSTRPRSP